MAYQPRSAHGKLGLFYIFIFIAIPIAFVVPFAWLERIFAAGNQPRKLSYEVGASPSCKPVNNVLFLKTHKTGSSTLTNILNRYGDSRDLLFALPSGRRDISFHWPLPFAINSTLPLRRPPNILCNHARYNKDPMNWLFPKETTRYITILREPTEQFESIFHYYHYEKRIKALHDSGSPLETLLQNPESFWSNKLWLMKNPALFDLGLNPVAANFTEVRDYIHFLKREFDLVMLQEYFDESLVLLKRRFCWKMEDILYFKLNERTDIEKGNLTIDAREKIRKWNWGDVLLYDVFNETLREMIAQEGPEFFNDLEIFRKQKESMKTACLREGDFLTRPFRGKFVRGYSVKKHVPKEMKETCGKMVMNELPYKDYLRNKMIKQLKQLKAWAWIGSFY